MKLSPPRRLLLLVVLLGLLAGGGWYAWRAREHVEPPAVDLTGVEPEVAAAIESAGAQVRQSPRSAAAWGQLGRVLAAHVYYDEANVCFAQAAKLDPGEARWPYFQGLDLAFSDSEAAIVHFRRAVELRPDDPALRLRLAEMLLSQGRLDEADEQYRALLRLDPANPRGQLGVARLADQRGDPVTARNALSPILDSPLTRKSAHTLLAQIEQRADHPTDATRERALAAESSEDEDWADPYVAEIEDLRANRQARLDRALRLWQRDPGPATLAALRELTRQHPDWDGAWLALGQALLQHKDYPGAEEALRQALARSPGSVEAHFERGVARFQRKDFRAAAADFAETARLKPDSARAHYNLGLCRKEAGDRPGAIDAFRAALRCRPNYAAAHANLAELLLAQDDKAGALKHARTALDLVPDDVIAKRVLESLQGKLDRQQELEPRRRPSKD